MTDVLLPEFEVSDWVPKNHLHGPVKGAWHDPHPFDLESFEVSAELKSLLDPCKLLVAGDTHNNIKHANYVSSQASKRGCDTVVQVGDFGISAPGGFSAAISRSCEKFGIKWYWLDGNHDNFTYLEEERAFGAEGPTELWPDITYMPRGYVAEWQGVRIMFLGGACSIDQESRTPNFDWWEEETITLDDVARAQSAGKIDILFCHDAPYGIRHIEETICVWGYKQDELSKENRRRLRDVFEACEPTLVVHGHFHEDYHSYLGNALVVGLNRDKSGNRSIMELDLSQWDALKGEIERREIVAHGMGD